MSLRSLTFLFSSLFCLAAIALAQETDQSEGRFGASDAAPVSRPISQREFADAASRELGFLANLHLWRDTLRGESKRDFGLAKGSEGLELSLGNVAPGEFGGGAGVAARWNRFEIGTTAQPQALEELLARFDSVWTGQRVQAQNPTTQFNWFRAQLSQSKAAQIEVSMARARRDSPDSARWNRGEFERASARFQLPAKWSLSGHYNRGQTEGDSTKNEAGATAQDATAQDATAWDVAASGPIVHPFGTATASANWRETQSGTVSPTDQSGAPGAKTGALEIAQQLKIGRLSGNLRFGANSSERAETEAARAGAELGRDQTRSTAQMQLALTPNLSVTGNGNWNSSLAQRALIDQGQLDSTKNEEVPAGQTQTSLESATSLESGASVLTPSQARELSRQLAGDLGMQWNFSDSLSLAVSLGTSSNDAHREIGDELQLGAQSGEARRALEVRRKSKGGDFRLRFSQRARRDSPATTNLDAARAVSSAAVSQWRIEAARQLIGMRFKTILDFANDSQNNQSARRIEAQLQLARAARFDARYRQGNLPSGLMSDEWSSVFAGSSSAPKQWSARFGAGSAASGEGLGLAVEVARSQGNLPDSWRVGVQFK